MEFFEPGKDLMVYRTIGELKEIIEEYRPKEKEREEMGLRGMAKVREGHTFLHRIKEIIDITGRQ